MVVGKFLEWLVEELGVTKMSKVTTEQVSQWVGDGFNVGFFNSREEALLEIITDVANGKYDIAELNADIMQWEDFKRICE